MNCLLVTDLKSYAKDANGMLNIEKHTKVINENKSALAKYLDNK